MKIPHRCSAWLATLLVLTGLAAGCNRAHYRLQADQTAYELIREKANSPLWDLQDYEIYIDPRSRMFDPFDPDTPPLPPDDPASHEYMHRVYGMRGYAGWHYSGETPFVENPAWLDYLPVDDNGILQLDRHLAQRLGRLHSRAYQAELEELYLSALDVSFERFRFDSQFFAGYQLFSTWDGADRRGGGGQSRSLFTSATSSKGREANSWTVQRATSTGGDLVVGFANSLVWQFAGPNDYSSVTLLDFTMLQPLLRGAGKDRILERLTLVERTLLANVRAMERYRGAFYIELMTGRAAQTTDGPQRRGGVLGGSGLEGFSGVGAGGFGRLATTGGIAGGQGGATGAGAGQAGGFIGLLQQQQQIRNQEDNIARLRTNLYRLETGLRELLTTIPAQQSQIPSQRLQVAQSRQALVLAESRLINARNQYEAQLDTYKGTLGLPPHVCVELNDEMLDGFQLIDNTIQVHQKQIDAVIETVGNTNDQILAGAKEDRDEETNIVRRSIEWSKDLHAKLGQLKQNMQPIGRINKAIIEESIPQVALDIERLREAMPRRVAGLEHLQKKYEEQKDDLCPLLPVPSIDPGVFSPEKLQAVDGQMTEELERLKGRFAALSERMEAFNKGLDALRSEGKDLETHPLFDRVRDDAVLAAQNLLTDLRFDLLALELCQARVRTFTIDLVPVDMQASTAMEIASRYRQDLMNARAALVDSWRLIEFNADNLESTLDITFSGDLSNHGQNPFDLRTSTGRMRAGLAFDAPIVRLSERNTYRQSQIEYQQARRNFYNSLDSLSRGLRSIVRSIETNQYNFEIQRYAVLAAIEQIDLNEDIRVLNEALRQPTGVTAARDSVSALTDLLNAQNDFLSIWINYQLQRMWLDLDMGTMKLSDDGDWLDPGPIGPEFVQTVHLKMGDVESGPIGASEADTAEPVPPGPPAPPAPPAPAKSAASTKKAEEKPSGAKITQASGSARAASAVAAPARPATEPKPFPPTKLDAERRARATGQAADPAVVPTDASAGKSPSSPKLRTQPVAAARASETRTYEPRPLTRPAPRVGGSVNGGADAKVATSSKSPRSSTRTSARSDRDDDAVDDDSVQATPRAVHVAVVDSVPDDSVDTADDQPQPVKVQPAAAIEPGPASRAFRRTTKPASETDAPKTFRPQPARRIGGSADTSTTRYQ